MGEIENGRVLRFRCFLNFPARGDRYSDAYLFTFIFIFWYFFLNFNLLFLHASSQLLHFIRFDWIAFYRPQ